MARPRILVLSLGGTITMLPDAGGGIALGDRRSVRDAVEDLLSAVGGGAHRSAL